MDMFIYSLNALVMGCFASFIKIIMFKIQIFMNLFRSISKRTGSYVIYKHILRAVFYKRKKQIYPAQKQISVNTESF